MKTLFLKFASLLLSLLMLSGFAQPANTDWVLQKSDDGIQIFSRIVGSNPLAETKGVTSVLGNIDSAFNLLQDPVFCASVSPIFFKTKILKKVGSSEIYYLACLTSRSAPNRNNGQKYVILGTTKKQHPNSHSEER